MSSRDGQSERLTSRDGDPKKTLGSDSETMRVSGPSTRGDAIDCRLLASVRPLDHELNKS